MGENGMKEILVSTYVLRKLWTI